MKHFNFISAVLFVAAALVYVCMFPHNYAPQVVPIDDTSMFLVTKQQDEHGKPAKYYRLMEGDDVVIEDWVKDNSGNPFCNCRGLVFMGQKRGQMELFNCRNGARFPILTKAYLDKINCELEEMRPRYDDENLVVICLQQKNIKGFVGKHTLLYNLKTEKLSSFIN